MSMRSHIRQAFSGACEVSVTRCVIPREFIIVRCIMKSIVEKLCSRLALGAFGVLFLLAGANTMTVAADVTYKLGVVPQFSAKRVHDIWQPVIQALHDKTGIKLELHGTTDIAEFGRALNRGKFDFAYMNPYHLLNASERQGYRPLARDVGKALQGVLVVRADSGVDNLEQLSDKKIAFPSPNALGASLLMRQELADRFNISFTPVYVRTHDSVYLNVVLKQAIAGGGVSKTLNKQSGKIRERLTTLYRTDRIVSHPVAVHPRVDSVVAEKIRQAFLSLSEDDEGRKILAAIPMKTPGVTTLAEYESLKTRRLERFATKVN